MTRKIVRTAVAGALTLALAVTSVANATRLTFAGIERVMPTSIDIIRQALNSGTGEKRMRALAGLESLLMPKGVAVGIDPAFLPENANWMKDGVADGMGLWQNDLADAPFMAAKPGQAPDVLVRFVDDINDGGEVQGKITVEHRFCWSSTSESYKTSAVILIRKSAGGRLLNREETAEVVGHELGHLLGLDDYDASTGLMGMFELGRPRHDASTSEVAAVNGFRSLLRRAIEQLRASR